MVETLLLQISAAHLVVVSATSKCLAHFPALNKLSLTLFHLDADRPEVGAVEDALVGAGEARDGRPVDVVLEQPPLWALVRHVGPRGNRSRDPCRINLLVIRLKK